MWWVQERTEELTAKLNEATVKSKSVEEVRAAGGGSQQYHPPILTPRHHDLRTILLTVRVCTVCVFAMCARR